MGHSSPAADRLLDLAIDHHQEGHWTEAELFYRQLLAADPNHADAHHLLGVLAAQTGKDELALQAIHRAIEIEPAVADYHLNLARVLFNVGDHGRAAAACDRALDLSQEEPQNLKQVAQLMEQLGRFEEAEKAASMICSLVPEDAEGWLRVGMVRHRTGDLTAAEIAYRTALAAEPQHTQVLNNLGSALHALRRLPEAQDILNRATAIDPNRPEIWSNLGTVQRAMGHADDAIVSFETALKLRPDNAGDLAKLGRAFQDAGRHEDALRSFRTALKAAPEAPEILNSLAISLQSLGRDEEAVAHCEAALAARFGFAPAHITMANALRSLGRLTDAEAACRCALADPEFEANALAALGNVQKDRGQVAEAIDSYRRSLTVDPDQPNVQSNLLMVLHYSDRLQTEDSLVQAQDWHQRFEAPPSPRPGPRANQDQGLRIGLLSAGFGRHPVGFLAGGVLARLPALGAHTVYYNTGTKSDSITKALRASADAWHDVPHAGEEELLALCHDDELDALIDLAGHGQGGRPGLFAGRPAQLAAKWIGGQFATTGLAGMDLFISNPLASPKGAERWHSEQLLRLPGAYATYAAPADAPDVGALPLAAKGHPTLGCFNALPKLSGSYLTLLSRLMQALPKAELLFKTPGLEDAATAALLAERLRSAGIDTARVCLRGQSDHPQHLATHNDVDLAIDSLPYSGGLTTCEALWMGVPVLTIPGPLFCHRHAMVHVHAAGQADLICEGPDQLVEKAVELLGDRDALEQRRASLRATIEASRLCNHDALAQALVSALKVALQAHE